MDCCRTSRMATFNSMLLSGQLCAATSKRFSHLQSSGNQFVMCMCMDEPKLVHQSSSAFRALSRRCGATEGFIQVGKRKKYPDESIYNPFFHGIVVSLRSRRCAFDDKNHANGVIVSSDDVDDHRKVLERFFVEKPESVWEEDEEVENEDLSRRSIPSVTMVKWEQDLMEQIKEEDEDKASAWWRKLDFSFQTTPYTRGIILLNLLTFLYGSNVSVIKNAGVEMDPSLFSVGRFAIASLAFAPFLGNGISNKKLVNVSAELGVWASMGYLTQCIAVLTSEAARISFISTFTVIVVPLLAGLSGAKISKITWGAAIAALVGVAFLESGGTSFAIGDVWSFVSAIMFGVHMLRTEQHSIDLLPEDSLPIISLQMVIITFFSGMWCLSSHLSSGDFSLSNINAVSWPQLMHEAASYPWLAMLYTGFLTTAFCLWCELVSLRDVKATEAAVIYTLEPLWGAAFAWILMGERWGANGWMGAMLILGGCLTMQLFGHPESPADANKETVTDSQLERRQVEIGKKSDIQIELPELTKSKRR